MCLGVVFDYLVIPCLAFVHPVVKSKNYVETSFPIACFSPLDALYIHTPDSIKAAHSKAKAFTLKKGLTDIVRFNKTFILGMSRWVLL